ncbi:MAG: nicotinamide riboside transporter PnuC [Bacteroidales bacterium]|jgi:nicotinamide mononucleotide transporter|nr:nicotinamide riboside transporter PnuC [Bacteroidales bacterium]MCK9499993.1 nicotinamide riboside transporter PnuC [Bacteroidales bacterium]MDY0315365.1 nicotinamide riboside transporter PnuC [Bacteroidales bacterium]
MIQISNWLVSNWVETLAAFLGLLGIFLQIKQNAWYWFTAIIMVILYIYVFFVSGFYADMSFQFYYLFVSIYGWIHWIRTKNISKTEKLQVFKLSKLHKFFALLVSTLFFVIIYLILIKFTDSKVPVGDAFTTALSITATWLLARKILENWLFWIVVDLISTILYVYKSLYPSAILFFVLTVLAVIGYFKWKKALVNE